MRKFFKCKNFEDCDINMPVRATINSAGYDISAYGNYIIKPKEICLINTGIKVCMNFDEVLKIYPRSSLAKKKGLFLSNHVGIIDSDYFNNLDNDGHIMISVYNFTEEDVFIFDKEKIVQGMFQKYLLIEDDDVQNYRQGGFGSTTK